MAIKGGKVKSVKALKSSLKKGSGTDYLQRIKEEGLTVRFIEEPVEWIEYFEYYDAADKAFYPEVEGVVLPMDSESGEKVRSSKRYLSNAVDTEQGKVIPLVLPKSVASILMKKYDKYGTLLDRDYEITREGTGLNTEYDVTPEPPMKMKMSQYTAIDLMAALEAQLPGGSDDEDDDEDGDDDEDEAPRRSKAARASRPAGKSSKRPSPRDLSKNPFTEDDDDDDDDEDEDDNPFTGTAVKRASKRPVAKKKPMRKRR